MQSAPKELLKEYVQSQQFTSTADIMQAMKEMFRDVLEQVMEVEMDDELGRKRCQRSEVPEEQGRNYRNGYSKKTVKTQLGEVDIKVPRDRQGKYEPKIIGKYDRNAEGMEEKILALYACGMSQRDISEQIKELYNVEISPEHESSKFWLNVLNDLKSRGVMDVYLFCTDGLCGMMQAIEAVFPNSRLQRCIVHQIRAYTRYVGYKDIKQVIADLKKIYTAVTLDEAENNLLTFAERWRKQYPSCVKSWEENWEVFEACIGLTSTIVSVVIFLI